MEQRDHFLEECEALAAVLDAVPSDGWDRATQFKGWTINDVVRHLYVWNRAADRAVFEPDAFRLWIDKVLPVMPQAGMRGVERTEVRARGRALFDLWQAQYGEMGDRWAALDPKARVAWVGPDMSVRSAITARQMETWAHGMEVFDLLGLIRDETDRIRNVVVLGVNTFGWSHKVHGRPVPSELPFLELIAPSGAVWQFGTPSDTQQIAGQAVEFAQVVTQTRNVEDTALRVTGDVAKGWMARAQCFAGPPETPPAPGTRFRMTG
ncbi:MAG: TIGR03084 family metal-binding protein [Pseudomonadota bacterium]